MHSVERIPLPAHGPDGGFDHAAVDTRVDRLYVAHPSNDAVEVVDLARRRHVRTLGGLRGVAGVWITTEDRLLFTSNRGEDTASVYRIEADEEKEIWRVPTGVRPNGMAYDPSRGTLLVAGVGDPKRAGAPPSLTFVDVPQKKVLATVLLPGRTRWALYHALSDAFYVNVADPASIVQIRADRPTAVDVSHSVAARGPHGLEQDPEGRTLFCACDDGTLMKLDVGSGLTSKAGDLSGAPDVLWVDPDPGRLYAAVGEPAFVDVFSLRPFLRIGTVPTGPGAHTLTVDPARHEVHVFLPETHEDLVLREDASG